MINEATVRLACKSAGFGAKAYRIAFDFPMSGEFSETLDSASVVLPHVTEADRLTDLEPYQEAMVEIHWRDPLTYLVDSFTEELEDARDGERYYTYTIELMSETKYLEKIQLPNLSITHSLVTGQKSIRHYIELYVAQYSPKIKMLQADGTFADAPLLTLDPNADWSRMDSPCADLAMSKPTLRQALTSLMIQVGCIPTVNNRRVGFLDFRAAQSEFKAPAGTWVATRSMASDSYVNTLVAEASNVVDADGASVSEELCFRDRDNVLLKQRENLFLETRFPIYSVKKLVMNAFVTGEKQINPTGVYWQGVGNKRKTTATNANGIRGGLLLKISTDSGIALKILPFSTQSPYGSKVNGTLRVRASILRPKAGGGYSSAATREFEQTLSWAYDYQQTVSSAGISVPLFQSAQRLDGDQIAVTAMFDGDAGDGIESMAFDGEPIFVADGSAFIAVGSYPTTSYQSSENGNGWYLASVDITPLCVESSKRSQLNVDFLNMPKWGTVKEMSNWLYATVGYSIGSNRIEGFSSTYSSTTGWWEESKTYIENLSSSIEFPTAPIREYWGDPFVAGSATGLLSHDISVPNPFFDKPTKNSFSVLFFDLEYVPLAEAKIAFTKDEADLPISQLDSADSGVSAIDSLSAKEADSVARFGNDVLAIHQRASSWGEVQPLNSLIDGHTVFKRTVKVGRNSLDVSYFASKNRVMKNYFASIVTKYRAYENVGYSQAVTRRELLWEGLMISKNGIVKSGEALSFKSGGTLAFVDSLLGGESSKPIENAGEEEVLGPSLSILYKGEVLAACSGQSATLCYSQFDNASNGIYVDGGYLDPTGKYYTDPIGGLPQKWYGRDEAKMPKKALFYSEVVGLLPERQLFPDSDGYEAYVRSVQKLPLVECPNGLSAVASLMVEADFGIAEKDAGERLEEVLQIEAFSDDGSLKAGKWLFRLSSAFGGCPSGGTVGIVYGGELRSQPYRPGAFQAEPRLFSLNGETDGGRCITMNMDTTLFEKDGPAKIAVVSNGMAYDLLRMENPRDWGTMRFSLNSQKGMGVFSEYASGGASILAKSHRADYGLKKKASKR